MTTVKVLIDTSAVEKRVLEKVRSLEEKANKKVSYEYIVKLTCLEMIREYRKAFMERFRR